MRTLLALFIYGCFVGAGISDASETKTVFVLFDISGTAVNSRDQYFSNFKGIIGEKEDEGIRPGDAIIAGLIKDVSLGNALFPINEEFKEMSLWTDKKRKFEKEVKNKKTHILDTAEKLLKDSKGSNATEIISAVYAAEGVFKKYGKNKNILVVFSDMIEESSYYNFQKENLTPKRIQQILDTEKSKKRVPDLKGIKVYVSGASASSSQKMLEIQNFWMQYFKECGAELKKENYGDPFRFKE